MNSSDELSPLEVVFTQFRARTLPFVLCCALAALLLGRRTYEFFAARWPRRSGRWADRLNEMPKYVVSATLQQPMWNNSTVLTGAVVDDVARLRRNVSGDVVVYASFQLVHTLMEADVVDELRLMIYPFLLGAGKRLFGETSGITPLRLVQARTVGDSLAFLNYQRPQRVAPGF
jgi:dihydrofolate reductase